MFQRFYCCAAFRHYPGKFEFDVAKVMQKAKLIKEGAVQQAKDEATIQWWVSISMK